MSIPPGQLIIDDDKRNEQAEKAAERAEERRKKKFLRTPKKRAVKWVERHNLPVTRRTIKRARKHIRAHKIKKLKKEEREKLAKGRQISYSESDRPWQVIYGTTRVTGIVAFLHNNNNKRQLHYIVTVAGHEIQAINYLYIDENLVEFGAGGDGWATGGEKPDGSSLDYTDKVYWKRALGASGQSAIAEAVTNLNPYWSTNHKQSGRAHAYILLKWDPTLFPEGAPKFSFECQGAKIYDPRTTTTAHSSNAALCIADYLTNGMYGLGYDWSEIDTGTDAGGLQWAADICDEDVYLQNGIDTEKRYTINGSFDLSWTRGDILENMAGAMAGSITYSNGKWKFFPGVYITPSETLTESDLRGIPSIQSLVSRKENFNSCRGTYVSSENGFEVTDFPPMSISAYVTEDNSKETWEDITLPFTVTGTMAQRIAKIEIERVRRSITVKALFGLKAFALNVGETVQLTLDRYGWSSKVFEVYDWEFVIDQDLVPRVELTLRESDSDVYDWDPSEDEQDVNSAPATDLPDPFIATAPTSLTLASGGSHVYTNKDGTVIARIYAAWTAPADAMVTEGGRIEVQYKKSADATYSQGPLLLGDHEHCYLMDVEDGTAYDVRIRSITAVGAIGDWVSSTGHIVEGKTDGPSDVSNFTHTFTPAGVKLSWDAVTDSDLAEYEIRKGSTWALGVKQAGLTATEFQAGFVDTGASTFWVAAKDTSGNYSDNPASTAVTVSAPPAPIITYEISGQNAILNWTEPAGSYPIREYEIRYGDSWALGTSLGRIAATSYRISLDFGLERSFYVAAYDTPGNQGASSGTTITLDAPGAVQSYTARVIDNNVILDWEEPSSGSLEVAYYKVYEGSTFAGATFIGTVNATFATYFKTIGGAYRYWVTAVDVAGNEGAETGRNVSLYNPPDYVLEDTQILDPADCITFTNCADVGDGETLIAPFNTSQTFGGKFTATSNTTLQDMIDDGYDYFGQPTTVSDAIAEWKIDLGAELSGSLISLDYISNNLGGTVTVTPLLSYSDDDVTYTAGTSGEAQVYGQDFRYIKVKLTISGTTTEALQEITDITLRVDVKLATDAGRGTSSAGSATTITFNKDFLDVRTVQVTPNPQAATEYKPVVDFDDTASPTSFDVYIFDSSGSQAAVDFEWFAEGVVGVPA